MKKVLVLVFILAFYSVAFGGAFVGDRAECLEDGDFIEGDGDLIAGRTTWGTAIFGSSSYKTDWRIKHFYQESAADIYQSPISGNLMWDLRHRFNWSNHIVNPPKVTYILEASLQTDMVTAGILGLGGTVDFKPNKKLNCNVGLAIKEKLGLSVSAGINYKW